MKSFAVAGPFIRNSLPAAQRTATLSLLTFAWHLKAYLFGWSIACLRTIYDALYKSTHHHHHQRHHTDHTALPVTHTFIHEWYETFCLHSEPQSIIALWPVLISCPTKGRRLSWHKWLVIYPTKNGHPSQYQPTDSAAAKGLNSQLLSRKSDALNTRLPRHQNKIHVCIFNAGTILIITFW